MSDAETTRRDQPAPERRQANVRQAVLAAAEALFAAHGFNAVSIRDIAAASGAHPGSVTYHFTNKMNLLREIYRRHCGPMNARRLELLREALRIKAKQDRLQAILRAYIVPAFSSSTDQPGGGAQFTRLRAALSAEGSEETRGIIAEAFDDTTRQFLDAIHETLPELTRGEVVWRSQFLLGSLYYTLINPERVTRLSDGEVDGSDMDAAIDQLVAAMMWGLMGPAPRDDGSGGSRT
ncbi:TetR/AcrR family transcriptional regulator [Lutibaculum baratangense]|nr:TetR/AcrR family transcriptional regulator [Lutibaculum baratangense]